MKSTAQLCFAALLLLSTVAPALPALAAPEKERMIARAPAIRALKDQGLIGEAKDGLLGFPTKQMPQPELIKAENSDRLAVYAAIAAKQQTTADHVAQRRYLQIVEQARPGDYLQDAKGAWYRKAK